MPTLSLRFRGLLAAGLLALACASANAQQPARDTVVVMRRDTLVVIQRDTVYVTPEPARVAPRRTSPEDDGYRTRPRRLGEPEYDAEFDLEDARAARRARLEELRRERAERLGRLGDARTSERALAYYLYPTRLLEMDFPALTFGVAYVENGRVGGMASLGVLTRPVNDFREIPEARGPVRGLDLGAEFRYYVSPKYRRFPMYIGGGGSYSWAPVQYTRFVPNPEGTFERLADAEATGRRIRVNALIGWELRAGGIAVDLTTGLEYHGRGVFTDDRGLARALDRDIWNNIRPNQYNPALYPVIRIGIGYGKW